MATLEIVRQFNSLQLELLRLHVLTLNGRLYLKTHAKGLFFARGIITRVLLNTWSHDCDGRWNG